MGVKNKICIIAGLVALSVTSASAADITIADNYIGKGSSDDVIGGGDYDIYNMVVSRVAGIMTVKINTKFVDINNSNKGFGDLFMSTLGWNPTGNAGDGYQGDNADTTNTQWNYAYELDNSVRYEDSSGTYANAGSLYDLNDYTPGILYGRYDYGNTRKSNSSGDHIYKVNDYYSNYANQSYEGDGSVKISKSNNYLEFMFDVTGTELETASQIAFHWTMYCANDVIEGVANFGNKVPEPAALGLLLMGVAGIGFARRRKQLA